MALKIRLRQQGRTNRIMYRLVVADSRSPRDGKYMETLGWYNPIEETKEKSLFVKKDRVEHWIQNGAQMTEKVRALVKQVAPQIAEEIQEKEMGKRAKQAEKRRAKKA